MFCNSCGKKIDDDSLFCCECGAKIQRIAINSISSDTGRISLAKPSDKQFSENDSENETANISESLYIPENNQQTEFSPENTSVPEPENADITETSPEPVCEDVEKIEKTISEYNSEEHKESLPKIVLKKNIEEPAEDIPEDFSEPYDDNLNTQYIPPFKNDDSAEQYIKNTYNDTTDTQYIPMYDNYDEDYDEDYREPFPPPCDVPSEPFPEYVGNQPYPVPPPPPEEYRPVKVGGLRLFGAGIVTFFTIIFLIVLSILFCTKLGLSGTVLEKGIKSLDMEKVLDAEYDSNRDVNDFLYEQTDFYSITNKRANKNDFRNFVLNLNITGYIGENVSVYADYILNGGKKPSLTGEDIAEYMFQKSGYNNLNRNDFSSIIYNIGDGQTDKILSVDEWKKETGFDFGISSYIFSFITLGILLALIIVLMIWTAVIVDKRGRYLTGFYKIIFMTSGIICLVIGITTVIVPPVVYGQTSHIVFYLGSKLLTNFSLFMLVTGGFELIAGIILNLINKLIVRHERKNRDG